MEPWDFVTTVSIEASVKMSIDKADFGLSLPLIFLATIWIYHVIRVATAVTCRRNRGLIQWGWGGTCLALGRNTRGGEAFAAVIDNTRCLPSAWPSGVFDASTPQLHCHLFNLAVPINLNQQDSG